MNRARQPVIRLKTEVFVDHCRRHGANDSRERANLVGIHRATVERVEDHKIGAGERVIRRSLEAFPDLKFEDLFEFPAESEAETGPEQVAA
jgi:hypothetical protein